jgi:hypothetical protein
MDVDAWDPAALQLYEGDDFIGDVMKRDGMAAAAQVVVVDDCDSSYDSGISSVSVALAVPRKRSRSDLTSPLPFIYTDECTGRSVADGGSPVGPRDAFDWLMSPSGQQSPCGSSTRAHDDDGVAAGCFDTQLQPVTSEDEQDFLLRVMRSSELSDGLRPPNVDVVCGGGGSPTPPPTATAVSSAYASAAASPRRRAAPSFGVDGGAAPDTTLQSAVGAPASECVDAAGYRAAGQVTPVSLSVTLSRDDTGRGVARSTPPSIDGGAAAARPLKRTGARQRQDSEAALTARAESVLEYIRTTYNPTGEQLLELVRSLADAKSPQHALAAACLSAIRRHGSQVKLVLRKLASLFLPPGRAARRSFVCNVLKLSDDHGKIRLLMKDGSVRVLEAVYNARSSDDWRVPRFAIPVRGARFLAEGEEVPPAGGAW